MIYDLLITNGRIIDGSGRPAYRGSIGVKDGKIIDVGEAKGGAVRRIDAGGLVVAPGLIDNHTHYDAQVTWDPLCTSTCYHGVTSTVFGNCSLSLAPAHEGDHAALLDIFSRVEAIPVEVLETGLKWGWESYGQYLDRLEGRLGINVGGFVGHAAIRRYVMGPEAHDRVQATEAELRAMKAQVRQAVASGALGLSLSRNNRHLDHAGRRIPSVIAPESEMFELASAVGELGMGILQCSGATEAELQGGLMTRLSRATGRPITYTGIAQNWGKPSLWKEHLAHTERTLNEGTQVFPGICPLPVNNMFTMKNCQVFDLMPTWKEIGIKPNEEKARLYADPSFRQRLRAEAAADPAASKNPSGFHRRWDLVTVLKPALPKNAAFKGRSVADIAKEQGKDVVDAFLDLALEEGLDTTFETNTINGDDQAVAAIVNAPHAIVGLSDAGAHLAFHPGYGTLTHFLAHFVREMGSMSWEEGIRKLTSVQAELYGLHGRGLLKPGYAADIVVFNPDTISNSTVSTEHDLPLGAERLDQRGEGIEYTIVNGQVLIEGGRHTGVLPGHTLRSRKAG